MAYFITIEELKQTTFNANLDNEYIAPALEEAQSIYLREIIGDLLYNSITNKIDEETLSGKYLTLVNQYIKPYLTYKVQSVIVIPLNNKTRNAGVIQQYDQGFNTSTMKDTAYLADYYNSRAEFYANRLTTYLQKNAADFPEYGYSDDNITQPTETQNVTTIYLGGGRKKGCGCNTSTPQATATTVEWDNIQNRPDFAQVAYSNDYNDLDNKPEIPSVEGYATEEWVSEQGFSTFSGSYEDLTDKPTIPTVNDALLTIKQGGVTKGTFSANSNQNIEIDLEAGGSGSSDWSDITNKPNFANVATSGDYGDLSHKPDLTEYVREADYNTDIKSIDNALADKVETASLCTINGERLDTRGDFELVRTDSIATLTITQGGVEKGTFTPNGNDVTIALDAGGAAQVQADWNEADSTAVDYIKNKPTIPTVPTNVSAFANDAGYLTQHQSLQGYATETWVQQQGYSTFDGDYNSLTNKPTIPAAQVQADWNANSGMGEILNKPSMTAETWTFTLSDNTTVTKTVWLQ